MAHNKKRGRAGSSSNRPNILKIVSNAFGRAAGLGASVAGGVAGAVSAARAGKLGGKGKPSVRKAAAAKPKPKGRR